MRKKRRVRRERRTSWEWKNVCRDSIDSIDGDLYSASFRVLDGWLNGGRKRVADGSKWVKNDKKFRSSRSFSKNCPCKDWVDSGRFCFKSTKLLQKSLA